MARDIDIDIDELQNFIEVLRDFQESTTDKLKAVESDWARCDESWQGDAKEQFTGGFEETKQSVKNALEAGDEACDWLERFYEIVDEFERH
jgi:uncharacterized protein YukE